MRHRDLGLREGEVPPPELSRFSRNETYFEVPSSGEG
jgi:hypothetical protein